MTPTEFGGVFQDLSVLVTGHTGFKGSWLSIWLRELGARVVGYSRDSGETPRNFDLCRLRDRLVHVAGDTRDAARLRQTIERHRPELVVHLAAQPLVKVSYLEPKRTFDTNVQGTVNLMEAIRQTQSVKAVLVVTTDKVYDDKEWAWGYRESDPLGGHDPYSASKAMAELALASYRSSWREAGFADHGVAIATARGGNVIGGGDFAQYRLVPDCMRALLGERPIEVGSPRSVRPWQHVLELLSGYLWLSALLLGKENGPWAGRSPADADYSEAWNFGPSEYESIDCETIAARLVALWGSGSYCLAESAAGRRPHETFALRLNWMKAATRLAWRPAYSWEQALDAIVRWFKEYQRQSHRSAQGGPDVDLYDLCGGQIADYVACARARGIRWADPAAARLRHCA